MNPAQIMTVLARECEVSWARGWRMKLTDRYDHITSDRWGTVYGNAEEGRGDNYYCLG
jgi:hypothetical protein